jgi:hypothetical protein
VPLSDLQSRLLRLLAAHRNPESYVAGASPLARVGPRFSADIDVFHDREEAVATTAILDATLIEQAGFRVEWLRRLPAIYVALIHEGDAATHLEWLVDSDFRFFPVVRDELFGYVLHLADIATNKALAAAGRREPRDVVDLLLINDRYLPLGAVIWAAVAKDPGFTPEGLIAEIRRNARYQQADYSRLNTASPIDGAAISGALRAALTSADTFVRAMPAGREGLLFLQDGRPVQPDPTHLDMYIGHAGQRHGHWPGSSEISSAMLNNDGSPTGTD